MRRGQVVGGGRSAVQDVDGGSSSQARSTPPVTMPSGPHPSPHSFHRAVGVDTGGLALWCPDTGHPSQGIPDPHSQTAGPTEVRGLGQRTTEHHLTSESKSEVKMTDPRRTWQGQPRVGPAVSSALTHMLGQAWVPALPPG